MDQNRRYSEEEIAAIFRQASEDQESADRQRSPAEGLTLEELHQIGHETGIAPELITRAASAVVRSVPTTPRSVFLGLPTSAARTVDLPGRLSDDDWNRLLIEIRETFHAHGKLERDGAFRSWRNGNLRIQLEPTADGSRLRMRTRKDIARTSLVGFLAAGAVAMMILGGLFLEGGVAFREIMVLVLTALGGLGGFGLRAFQLSRWAKERESQMDAISARALEYSRVPAPAASSVVLPSGIASMDLAGAHSAPDVVTQGEGESQRDPGSYM